MVERLERLCFLVSHATQIGGAVIPTDSTWLLVGGFHAKGQRFTHFLFLAITFLITLKLKLKIIFHIKIS